ncbi:MAG: hypothetical protein A4E25_01350 [Methanobacterium sp. PtaB.Bin024]|jgi:Mn2+/Fe2+ NRAMP family transporter|nr:MAG: hypothetical protein A4E25_01350 [Methanobacterium sp. PtaB.Bin024]
MYNLIFYWIITVIVEFLVIWLFIQNEPLKLLVYSILINSITLPLATFSYLYLYPNFFLTETVVFLAEGIFLKLLLKLDYSKAFMIALAANLVTGTIGFLLALN